MTRTLLISLLGMLLLVVGCSRNHPSEKPPIHLVTNMDEQPKYKAQSESRFFADGITMRQPVEGTVPRGYLREDVEYYTGMNSRGQFITQNPRPINLELMERGRDRYDIFCSPCHGRTGYQQGIIVKKGLLPPPSLHEQRLRDIEDGYIYNVITNGLRNMPPYKYQIPPADRWAIVAYFRALQRSQNATAADIPDDQKEGL